MYYCTIPTPLLSICVSHSNSDSTWNVHVLPATPPIPLCQCIHVSHSNSDSTWNVHVYCLCPALPCNVMFVQVAPYILWMAMVYTFCHSYIPCTASTVTCTCNLSEDSCIYTTVTLAAHIQPLHHYPSVRVSLYTTVTLAVCVHYVYTQCTTTPLSEYPCTPQ